MTKLRSPGSIFDAVFKVVGELSPERVSQICERSDSWARKIGDPDSDVTLGLRDAVKLDLAYREFRGHSPITEAMAARLEQGQVAQYGLVQSDTQAAAKTIKETGEAILAFGELGENASRFEQDKALVEVSQMIDAAQVMRALIEAKRLTKSGSEK